jgi:hypothetical protein
MRARSGSAPARPYIERFSVFRRLTGGRRWREARRRRPPPPLRRSRANGRGRIRRMFGLRVEEIAERDRWNRAPRVFGRRKPRRVVLRHEPCRSNDRRHIACIAAAVPARRPGSILVQFIELTTAVNINCRHYPYWNIYKEARIVFNITTYGAAAAKCGISLVSNKHDRSQQGHHCRAASTDPRSQN